MTKTSTSWVDFTACKQIPLIEICQALGIPHEFTKHGESWRGVCPLPSHVHGKTPNARQFVITQKADRQLWHCFGCQQGGDGVSMVRLVASVDNNGAREWFLQHFGESVTASRPPDEVSTPVEAAQEEQEIVELKPLKFFLDLNPAAAAEYLKSRGITVATAEHFGVGLASRGLMAGRVAFPIHRPAAADGENPCGYCGRSVASDVEPKYLWPRDFLKSRILFGLQEALADSAPFQPIGIVESPFSVLTLYQHGIAAACTFGAQLSGDQAEMIAESGRPVWILFDPDEAGILGAIKAKYSLHEHGCLLVAIVELPGQPDTLAAETLRECLHL